MTPVMSMSVVFNLRLHFLHFKRTNPTFDPYACKKCSQFLKSILSQSKIYFNMALNCSLATLTHSLHCRPISMDWSKNQNNDWVIEVWCLYVCSMHIHKNQFPSISILYCQFIVSQKHLHMRFLTSIPGLHGSGSLVDT